MMYLSTRFLRLARSVAWEALASVLLASATILSSVGLIGTSAYLISYAALHPSIAVLQVAIVGVRFFGISRAIFRYLERLSSHSVSFRLVSAIRQWFYNSLEPLTPARIWRYRSGDLLHRAIADHETLDNLYVRGIAPLLAALVTALISAGILWGLHPLFSVNLLVMIAISALGLPLLVRKHAMVLAEQVTDARSILQSELAQLTESLGDLKVFGGEEWIKQTLFDSGNRLRRVEQNLANLNAFSSAASQFINLIAFGISIYAGTILVNNGDLDGRWLASAGLMTFAAFEAVLPIPAAYLHLNASRVAAQRLLEIITARPEVEDMAQPISSSAHHTIEMNNLSFTYPSESVEVLREISLSIPDGKKIALIGPSGSGKSTLIHLLLKFWKPGSGSLRIGGVEVSRWNADALRALFMVVLPDSWFAADSLWNNLLLAKPDISPTVVSDLLRGLALDTLVESHPQGINLPVGDRGIRLSGGERQRLAILRMLLLDRPMVILDEPTAGMDALTEAKVIRTLQSATKDKTVLWVTHRITGLDWMDEILVMNDGRIVQRGTHADLTQEDGLYRRMLGSQNRLLQDP